MKTAAYKVSAEKIEARNSYSSVSQPSDYRESELKFVSASISQPDLKASIRHIIVVGTAIGFIIGAIGIISMSAFLR